MTDSMLTLLQQVTLTEYVPSAAYEWVQVVPLIGELVQS